MDLIVKYLDVLGACQRGLELLDVLDRLVLGRQHGDRDLDLFGVGGVDHGWVTLGRDLERILLGGGSKGDDFGTPAELAMVISVPGRSACSQKRTGERGGVGKKEGMGQWSGEASTYTDNAPLLDVRILGRRSLDDTEGLGDKARRAILAEEGADLLLLVLVVGREQLNGQGRAVEGIRDEYGVLVVVVGGGQDVGALQGLVEEAEDVHDHEDALGGRVGGPGDVRLAVVDGGVVALLLIARRDDRGNVAAGGGMATGGFHGRHLGGGGGAELSGELSL